MGFGNGQSRKDSFATRKYIMYPYKWSKDQSSLRRFLHLALLLDQLALHKNLLLLWILSHRSRWDNYARFRIYLKHILWYNAKPSDYAKFWLIKKVHNWITIYQTYVIHHVRSSPIVRSNRNFIFGNYLESNSCNCKLCNFGLKSLPFIFNSIYSLI